MPPITNNEIITSIEVNNEEQQTCENSRSNSIVNQFWEQASGPINLNDLPPNHKILSKNRYSKSGKNSILLNVNPSLLRRLSKNYHPNLIMQNNFFESTAGRLAREKRERL